MVEKGVPRNPELLRYLREQGDTYDFRTYRCPDCGTLIVHAGMTRELLRRMEIHRDIDCKLERTRNEGLLRLVQTRLKKGRPGR